MNKLTLFKFNGEGNIPGTKSGSSRCFFLWGVKIMLFSLVLRRCSSSTSEHGLLARAWCDVMNFASS